jgi:predicted dehydrogenase
MVNLRIGFTGARRSVAFRHFAAFEGVENWALTDPDKRNLAAGAEQLGIPPERCFTELEPLLDSGINVLVAASPMPFHVPQAVAALERDIHVLSEVTAAVNLAQCRDLVRAVRRSKAKYMMAENYVFAKVIRLVGEIVKAGLFGDPYYAEGEYIHNVESLFRNPDGSPTWRMTWQTGRNGITYGTHSLGPCLSWLGERVVSVSCVGSGVHTMPDNKMEDSVVMLCKTERGHLVRIRQDIVSHRPHCMGYYSLQGTKGCYEAPRAPGDYDRIWLADRHSNDADKWHSLWEFEEEFLPKEWRELGEVAAKTGHGGGDFLEVHAFIESIRNDTNPPIDVYTALDWTLPGLMSEQSIALGGAPVIVPDPRTTLF